MTVLLPVISTSLLGFVCDDDEQFNEQYRCSKRACGGVEIQFRNGPETEVWGGSHDIEVLQSSFLILCICFRYFAADMASYDQNRNLRKQF